MLDPHSVTISNTGTFTITATSGAISGTSNSFNVNPAAGGFNVFEISVAPVTAISGPIYTKVSGSSFSLDLVALNVAKTAQTVFTGTVTTSLLGNTILGVALDGDGCPVTFTTLQTMNVTMTSTARQTITFAAVPNVWRDVRIRISYAGPPVVTSCSGDNFAIRSASLSIAGVTDATPTTVGTTRTLANVAFVAGNNVHHAGRPFTITVTAANSSGVTTTNYAGSPTALVSGCAAAGPPAACTASFGTLDLGTWSAAAGVVTTSTATYSEVRSFGLQVEDQSFASVDAGDGSTTAQRYIPLSTKVDVGRFVPDSYVISAPSISNRADIAGCHVQTTGSIAAGSSSLTVASAANLAVGDAVLIREAAAAGADLVASITGVAGTTITLGTAAASAVAGAVVYKVGFTYHGEPIGIGYTITARGALSPAALANYNGAWARGVVSLQAENNNDGTDRSARLSGGKGSWVNGTYAVSASNLSFSRLIPPDGPFNRLQIGVTVADPDGPVLQGRTMNPATAIECVALANCTGVAIGTIGMRFGRLRLSNAHGSELLNLPIPLGAEYWSGSYFEPNTLDSCTSIAAANVAFGNYQGGINGGNMTSPGNVNIGGSFVAGKGGLTLTKPMPAPTAKGSVDLTIDLGAESKTYLRVGPAFNANPTARAAFGIYKRQPMIYVREMY